MTKLEREIYLLALNDSQRLALLLMISKLLKDTDGMSLELFEEVVTSYRTKEETRERR